MKKYLFLLGLIVCISISLLRIEAAEDVVVIGLENVLNVYEAGTDPDSIDLTNGLQLNIIHENVLADDKLFVDYSLVDFNKVGIYPVTYYVLYLVDEENVRVDLTTLDISIEDTTLPSLYGVTPLVVEINTKLTDINFLNGVSATDNDLGSDLDIKVFNINSINTSKVGVYPINYVVSDDSLNYTKKQTLVFVSDIDYSDTTKPTLTINQESLSVGLNSGVHDYLQYAEAIDSDGTNLNDFIQYDDSNIDYTTIGKYELLYMVSDFSGNLESKKVDVYVVDDTSNPYFINFPDIILTTINAPFDLKEGIKAFDDVCGDLTDLIDYSTNIDITKFGEYTVTFNVADLNNNETSKSVQVIVGDYINPTIIGESSFDIKKGADFNIYDFLTITDNYDDDLTIETKLNGLNLNKTGSYLIEVSATDNSGNVTIKKIMVDVGESNNKIYQNPVLLGSLVGVVVSGMVTIVGIVMHKKRRKYY